MDIIEAIRTNLLTPPLLFFALGVAAGCLKSDLAIPQAIAKGLALYLLIAIGFEGGAKLAQSGLTAQVFTALAAGVLLSLLLPLLGFVVLRRLVDPLNAAAIAAHYGSVSAVTFVTCTAFLQHAGIEYEPFLVALMAVMESPAIATGLVLARRYAGMTSASHTASVANSPSEPASCGPGRPLSSLGIVSHPQALAPAGHATSPPSLLREILLNSSIVLLAGSLLIGSLTGEAGAASLRPVLGDPFQGILSFFLLEMGLTAGRGFAAFRSVGFRLVLFGLGMPVVGGLIGATVGAAIGLSSGGSTLLAVLAASASYIAVPAAMRIALPGADPSLSITLALGVTFPFNVLIGIPLYLQIAEFARALV